MANYLVAAVDGARARFFQLEDTETPEIESGPDLVEIGSLCNPESEMLDEEVFTNTKSGGYLASSNGKMHGYDDHRSQHMKEFEKRFAHHVADAVKKRVQGDGVQDIIMVATPAMTGHLRPLLEKLKKQKKRVHSVQKDASKMSPRQVHELLSGEDLLPARRSASGPMGARRRRA